MMVIEKNNFFAWLVLFLRDPRCFSWTRFVSIVNNLRDWSLIVRHSRQLQGMMHHHSPGIENETKYLFQRRLHDGWANRKDHPTVNRWIIHSFFLILISSLQRVRGKHDPDNRSSFAYGYWLWQSLRFNSGLLPSDWLTYAIAGHASGQRPHRRVRQVGLLCENKALLDTHCGPYL